MPTTDHLKRAAGSHRRIRTVARELSAAEEARRLADAQATVAAAEQASA